MADENKTIIIALIAAIVISLGGTFIVLNKLTALTEGPLFTGLAPTDTGTVNITITTLASIIVNSTDTNERVDFGTCNVPSSEVNISSNLTQATINATSMNCTGGNLKMTILGDGVYHHVVNLGNVDIEVNLSSNVIGSDLLTGSTGKIYFWALDNTAGDCDSGLADSAWTEIAVDTVTTPSQRYLVCTNFNNERLPAKRGLRIYYQLQVPPDAVSLASTDATITYYATDI